MSAKNERAFTINTVIHMGNSVGSVRVRVCIVVYFAGQVYRRRWISPFEGSRVR